MSKTNSSIDVSSSLGSLNNTLEGFTSKLPEDATTDDSLIYYKIGAWAMLAISIGLLVICVAFRKKVATAIGVLKEASKAIQDIPVVILFPGK